MGGDLARQRIAKGWKTKNAFLPLLILLAIVLIILLWRFWGFPTNKVLSR